MQTAVLSDPVCVFKHVWAVYMGVNYMFFTDDLRLLQCAMAGKDIPCPAAILAFRFGVWKHCSNIFGLSYTVDAPPVKYCDTL